METIADFVKRKDIKKLIGMDVKDLLERELGRDPMRAIYYDRRVMYAPADGFIIFSGIVEPDEEMLKVKGGTYSVNTLLREKVEEKCLVIQCFMSCVDVHVQRIPTNGIVSYTYLPALKVMNLSMRPIETAILKNMKIDIDNLKYEYYNERTLFKVFAPLLKQHYFILLTADFEVDTICPFQRPNESFTQGERFCLVRMGSQCTLVIPFINKKIQFASMIPEDGEIYHIEAGIDDIVHII